MWGQHSKSDNVCGGSVSTRSAKGSESSQTLFVSVLGAGSLDMRAGQRVYTSNGEATVHKGCTFNVALILPTKILYLTGVIAQAQSLTSSGRGEAIPDLGFIELLGTQPSGFKGFGCRPPAAAPAAPEPAHTQQMFCIIAWVRVRFGRGVQLYVSVVNLACMWIPLVAERTSRGNLIFSMEGLGFPQV